MWRHLIAPEVSPGLNVADYLSRNAIPFLEDLLTASLPVKAVALRL